MKKKTKKARKPSYKQLTAHAQNCSQNLNNTLNDLSKARCRADKYEKAYRDLKNNLGQYLALLAGNYGVDPERAKKLQEEMFKEPVEQGIIYSAGVYSGDFGNITVIPCPSFK